MCGCNSGFEKHLSPYRMGNGFGRGQGEGGYLAFCQLWPVKFDPNPAWLSGSRSAPGTVSMQPRFLSSPLNWRPHHFLRPELFPSEPNSVQLDPERTEKSQQDMQPAYDPLSDFGGQR